LHQVQGQVLLDAGAEIDGEDEYLAWRHRRHAWTQVTTFSLEESSGHRVAETFRRAATVNDPRAGWRAALVTELQAVEHSLEVLALAI
jgi:hypothetical protein